MRLDVVEGYLSDGEFTARLNHDWQSPDQDLPDDVVGTDEEKEGYGGDEVYRAADGKIFLNYDAAKAYNDSLVIPELNEVLDLLERAKILCSTASGKSPVLSTIKDALTKIEQDGGEYLMNKYYDSTC